MHSPPKRASADDTFAKLLRVHAWVRGGAAGLSPEGSRHLADLDLGRGLCGDPRARPRASPRSALEKGDRIAIAGANRPRLYWSIAAAQMLGAIPVPVYADSVAEEIAAVLENAGASLLVAQDQEQVDKALVDPRPPARADAHPLRRERGLADYDDPRLTLARRGHAARAAPTSPIPSIAAALDALHRRRRTARDPSIMLYTSGTTGKLEGRGAVAASAASPRRATPSPSTTSPTATKRSPICRSPGSATIISTTRRAWSPASASPARKARTPRQEDLREIGPTFHFAPPRVFEALLTRVIDPHGGRQRARSAGCSAISWTSRGAGARRSSTAQPSRWLARLHYALGELLIYGPLKNTLGFTRIRVAYTAGEAIGADLFAFYRSLGLNLKQLYGQTEAFLYVTAQADGAVRSDTVGPPAPNVQLRIADDGEVQFKSPGMFVGYYNDPEKTREALTPDGFVKTGDAGFFEPDGQLKIIDRAKDVGRLANGQMFAPKYIENKLKFFADIREAVAIGDGRDFVAVMLNIELASVGAWAERNGVSYASYQELAGHPRVAALIEQHVDAVNRALGEEPAMAGAQIRRFLILPKELDADDGELTRTQKVRRGFIAERYAPLVDGLYDGASEAAISAEITYEDGRKGRLDGTSRIVDDARSRTPRERSRAA